jgi:hypothetical protein
MRNRNIIVSAVIVVAVIIAIIAFTRYSGSSSPAAETAFIAGMQPIMAQVQNPAGTDLDSWRRKRAALICSTITGLQVTDWVGTVDKVDTSIAGGAILSIAVLPDVDFGTAPNALSNITSNTLIDPGSTLFHTIAGLQVGQKLVFSGQLFASQPDCIQEASVTEAGGMQNPLFVTRFTSLTPLPHSDN